MIIIYVLLILISALIIWLILRKKWKTLLGTIISIIIITIVCWYVFLHAVSEAFGAKCETNRVWKINNYEIVEKKCIGFAGPHYYPVYLYKDSIKIDQLPFINDTTCVVEFNSKEKDILSFDICKMELKKK